MKDGSEFTTPGSDSPKTKAELGPVTFLVALTIICATILGLVSLVTGNPIIR